ncbi:MAG: hypothetical protein ACRC5C_08405, partial [Bacilli bacterium]
MFGVDTLEIPVEWSLHFVIGKHRYCWTGKIESHSNYEDAFQFDVPIENNLYFSHERLSKSEINTPESVDIIFERDLTTITIDSSIIDASFRINDNRSIFDFVTNYTIDQIRTQFKQNVIPFHFEREKIYNSLIKEDDLLDPIHRSIYGSHH